MAESIGALRAELSAGHAQFASDMKKARDALVTNAQGMAKGMETAQKSFNAGTAGLMSFRVKALAAATVTGMLAKTVINMADDYTLLDNKLKLVTTSSDNLKAVQEGLYQQSLRSHSSYSSSVDLYARFAKATETMGTGQSDLLRITETLNKAMVISGATQQEATNGIIQLSQGMASGAIPLVVAGVKNIFGAPEGVYRDGGLIDYHLSHQFAGKEDDLVLFFHHEERIVPGWLDKKITKRAPDEQTLNNVVMIFPSQSFVDRLPDGKIPDRDDFLTHIDDPNRRIENWNRVASLSAPLGEEFLELVESGRLRDIVEKM